MVIRHGDAVAGESDGGASTREVRALNAADEGQKEHVRHTNQTGSKTKQRAPPNSATATIE